ncbi:hypothetical protein HY572_01770 [Candidatus Micrarchaeota archaeon]|nr:hypothetical protein [Candidatus Micrarchaeota archaeon]
MHEIIRGIRENLHVTDTKKPVLIRMRTNGPHLEVHYASKEHYKEDEERIRAIAEKHGFRVDITRSGTNIRRIQLPPEELEEWHRERVRLKNMAKIPPGEQGKRMAEILESLKDAEK